MTTFGQPSSIAACCIAEMLEQRVIALNTELTEGERAWLAMHAKARHPIAENYVRFGPRLREARCAHCNVERRREIETAWCPERNSVEDMPHEWRI